MFSGYIALPYYTYSLQLSFWTTHCIYGRTSSLFLLLDRCTKKKHAYNIIYIVEILSLSFVGNVFFSWVSVFFSLFLSNEVTSDTSGLSDIAFSYTAGQQHSIKHQYHQQSYNLPRYAKLNTIKQNQQIKCAKPLSTVFTFEVSALANSCPLLIG